MDYQMLVLDIDGTLVTSKKEISPATLDALISLEKQGFYITIASGRPTAGVRHVAEKLELDKYGNFIVSFNGSRIINCKTKQVIYDRLLPDGVLPDIYKACVENGIGLMTYERNDDGLEHVISATPLDKYEELEARCNDIPIVYVPDFLNYVNFPLNKLLMTGEPDHLAKVEEKFKKMFRGIVNVFRSEPFFLEFTPLNVDKATSLQKLLNSLGLTADQMICCGDGFNDITMIEYAGLGVAMANAQPPVKEAANFVTSSNDEDGIVNVINKFILKK